LTRKERWSLSWRGALIAALLVLLSGLLLVLNIQPFLAVTQRADARVLVAEGWVHDFAIRAAADEFRSGSYDHVYVTGGPVAGLGHYVNDYQTSASVGAERLAAAGVPTDRLQMVPSHVNGRDRTYSSAVALRDWFRAHHVSLRNINVVTEDVHARRTRLLFQKALGPDVEVGIIAAQTPDYDPKRWWRYSEGVRDVIGESIAYVYARFFFWPKE
jgi:uncharacterized SAM-binding protein YcdF (DUF218 family)